MWLRSSLEPEHGFHRTYSTTIALTRQWLQSNCSLYLMHSLPSHIFVDPFELEHHQNEYTFKHWGTSNLELPVTAISPEGSSLLLNVTLPKSDVYDNAVIAVQVPLHLRYGKPLPHGSSGYHREQVPWPVGYSACSGSSKQRPPVMPTEFASLIGSQSITLIPPTDHANSPVESVELPVGNYGDLVWVEVGTAMVILVAFVVLLHAAYKTGFRTWSHIKVE